MTARSAHRTILRHAVVHRHAGFLGRLLHPSASKAIAERIDLPLLVLQE